MSRKIFGIIASLPAEMAVLERAMENPCAIEKAGLRFLMGEIAGKQVAAVICGVGKVNGARTAQVLVDHFAPDAIIHTGVAGSLCDKAAHLSLVVSERLVYHDADGEWLRTTEPFTDVFPADPTLCKALVAASAPLGSVSSGLMATGDRFIDDPAVKQDIFARTGALCVDMEIGATAHVAMLNRVPYCAIKCISDMSDDSSGGTFADFVEIAADKAAGAVLGALERL